MAHAEYLVLAAYSPQYACLAPGLGEFQLPAIQIKEIFMGEKLVPRTPPGLPMRSVTGQSGYHTEPRSELVRQDTARACVPDEQEKNVHILLADKESRATSLSYAAASHLLPFDTSNSSDSESSGDGFEEVSYVPPFKRAVASENCSRRHINPDLV